MKFLLEAAVTLVYFTNKVLWLFGAKAGWLVGTLGASLAALYFWKINLFVYVVLNLGLIVLMTYGHLKGKKKNLAVELAILLVTFTVICFIAWRVFSGLLLTEFFSSVGIIVGTYLLAHNQKRLGWAIYGLAQILAAKLGYDKGQGFFCVGQILSAIVCCLGCFFNPQQVRDTWINFVWPWIKSAVQLKFLRPVIVTKD